MKVNKLNYEAYAIDYLESNLSPADRQDFEKFLKQYPDIKQELDDYLEGPVMQDLGNEVFIKKEDVRQKNNLQKRVWILMLLLVSLGTVLWLQKETAQIKTANPVNPVNPAINTEMPDVNVKRMNTVAQPPMANKNIDVEAEDDGILEEGKKLDASEILAKSVAQKESALSETHQIGGFMPEPIKVVEAEPTTKEAAPHQERKSQVLIASTQSDNSSDLATPAVKQNVIQPFSEVVLKPKLEVRHLASLATKNIVSSERETPVLDVTLSYVEAVAAETQPRKKKSKWLKILTPQAYNNLNLKDAIASSNLKSAVTEIEKALVPETLITK